MRPQDERIDWLNSTPIILVHLIPLLAIWTGARWTDWVLCVVLYYVRMFFLTAGYHRYFAHRSYGLGRGAQFVMAVGGATCAQKGPLWWAGIHRHHHKFSDTQEDAHTPLKGFFWSHMGWFMCGKWKKTDFKVMKDFAAYPELRLLNRFWIVPPALLAIAIWIIGGAHALLIGFFLSTVLLYHGTFTVNSLAHVFGRRRYATDDASRNSALIALLTMGEGWHNNHHHCQTSARQGFQWWEFDPSFYVLKAMSWVRIRRYRLVRKLMVPNAHQLTSNRLKDGIFDHGLKAYREARKKAKEYYRLKKREFGAAIDSAKEKAAAIARPAAKNDITP